MKLTVPPLEIGEDEGFSDDKDIFRRREFGERLANLIENTDGELVIALDAPWGEGKSTFIKMWRGHLKNTRSDIKTIYFDAFENDHQSTPFLALAGEIYNLIDEKNEAEKSEFKDKAIAALKTTTRIGLRIGVKALTAGFLDGTELEKYEVDKDVANETSNAVDKLLSNYLKSASKDKENLNAFKDYLKALPAKLGGKSIVFIIDELDRCKPPFALEIVEVVKHLFSVPNITFVLVMNRAQLEASVTKEYGTLDPSKYLQKFINLWVSLPKVQVSDESTTKVYLRYCVKQMEMEAKSQNEAEWAEMFEELVIYYNLSLRDIERCLTNLSLIRIGLKDRNLNHRYQWICAYLSIIKVIYPQIYKQIATSHIDYPVLFTKTNLDALQKNWTFSEQQPIENHYLKWLLRYYLANDEQARELLSKGNHLGPGNSSNRQTAMKDICMWLDSFRI